MHSVIETDKEWIVIYQYGSKEEDYRIIKSFLKRDYNSVLPYRYVNHLNGGAHNV